MTHPPRFIDPILAQPGEDDPRLLYANWLDGCGNPLGEFIRLQCILARNPPSEPSLFYERREQELLAKFKGLWCEALSDRVEWCSFRRGFVEEVSLTDRQLIRHARDLFVSAPVRDLHVKSDGRRLDDLPELPELQHPLFLDLSSQRLGPDGFARLADAPFLNSVHGLNLGSSLLDDIALEALSDSTNLSAVRELYLNDNPITDDGIRQFVMSPIAEHLELLDVRDTRISHESRDILKHMLGENVLC
jgi:uncharacterized protein (TIGR02996 family)